MPAFVRRIRDLGFKVKLDTNGFFPDRLVDLISDHLLDYVAMDVKNSPDLYGKTVGIEPCDLSGVLQSIELLIGGNVPYEFRTTVSKTFHTEESLRGAGEMIKGADAWFLQAFKNSGNLIDNSVVGYDENELQRLCNLLQPYAKRVSLRGV